MAMQTVRESLLSSPQISWWNGFGSQPLATETLAGNSDSFTGVKSGASGETDQGVVDKQSNSATHLAFSLVGDVKSSRVVPKPHGAAFSVHSSSLELGFTQPPMYTKYPYGEQQQYYGVVSAYGSYQSRVMIPLNMETEDGTIYVNSKQYHGILRRRQSRAKAAAILDQNKLNRCRKPYMHHSRHLHALRRPRGSGGRFLNTKSQNMEKNATSAKKAEETKQFQFQPQQSNSQNSEVLHPESNVTMNLSNGLNVSAGSEVTSMNNYFSSVHSLGGMLMPHKWIATAAMDNGCCNYKT